MDRIKKVNKDDFRIYTKECAFCHEQMDIKKVDVFLFSVPGIEQLICRHCLVKLYTQIGDALRPPVDQNADREPFKWFRPAWSGSQCGESK